MNQNSKQTPPFINLASSIWERLPYNIGMELHHCKPAVVVDNSSNNNNYHLTTAATTTLKTTKPPTYTTTCKSKCCCYQHSDNLQQSQFPPTTTASSSFSASHGKYPARTNDELRNLKNFQTSLVVLEQPSRFQPQMAMTSSDIVWEIKEKEQLVVDDPVDTVNDICRKNEKKHFPVDNRILTNLVIQFSNTNAANQSTTTTTTATALQRLPRVYKSNVNSHTNSTTTTSTTTTTTTTTTQRNRRCCSVSAADKEHLGDIISTDSTLTSMSSDRFVCEFPRSKLKALKVQKFQLKLGKDKAMTLAIMYLFMYIFSVTTQCWAARQDALSNCTFPQRWEGSWFLSGYQQSIHIKGSQFSYRGKCTASDGNKYLIVDEKGCHRCLVIYEKHKNVLQYKESECEGDSMYMHQSNPSAMAMRSVLKSDHRGGAHPNSNGHSRLSSSDQYIMRSNDDMNDCPPDFCKGRETLQNLCDQIPGDALLFSLFRESAEPVKCPLKGPFIFTYNRGHGECKSPVSNIDSCTEDSRLLLSFQACHDVQGTESTVEELTCLATWKDGNSRYLVGLVSHHHAISNEERYRCFVYEKISSLMVGPAITSSKDAEYKLAQSGDATCNGLDSAEVGSRIMSLRKPPPAERCDFPAWFKGPRHWHALMGNAVYNYHPNDGSMHIIKPNGYMETRALCEQINKQTSTEMMAVVHYTTGCQSGFMCMMFYRRDTHVIEIQTGKQASRLEDACAPDHFDINKMPYITLLASNPDPQICPLEGLYNLRGAIGPPYISSRHKRNHNNKAHSSQHGHHHLQHEVTSSGGGSGAHKRHSTLSYRNSEEIGHSSWHSHTRGLPIRSRRDAATNDAAALSSSKNQTTHLNGDTTIVSGNHRLSKLPTSSSEQEQLNREASTANTVAPQENSESGKITITASTTLQQMEQKQQQQQPPLSHEDHRQRKLSGGARRTAAGGVLLPVNGIVSNDGSDNISAGGTRTTATSASKMTTTTTTTTTVATTQQRSRRDAPGCIVNYKAQRQLWIGCTGPNLIDVRPQCNDDGDEEYSCHGSWSENGTVYVIARHKGTKHGVCISYRPMDGTAAKLVIGDACYRGILKPPEHHLVANLTVFGKCGDTSSASSMHPLWMLTMIGFILPITMFTNR